MNVPAKKEYRNRRGLMHALRRPAVKAARAVIGGGNSGVEAAIDLAGIGTMSP